MDPSSDVGSISSGDAGNSIDDIQFHHIISLPIIVAVVLACLPSQAQAQDAKMAEHHASLPAACLKHVDCPSGMNCLKGACIQQEEWHRLVGKGKSLRIAGGVMLVTASVLGAISIPIALTSYEGFGVAAALASTGATLMIAGHAVLGAGFLQRKRAIRKWMQDADPSGYQRNEWAWKFNRYWYRYLITGYVFLGTGLALAPVGLVTDFSLFPLGLTMVAVGIPFVIVGHVFKTKRKSYPLASVLPYLSPVPGGAVAGLGGMF